MEKKKKNIRMDGLRTEKKKKRRDGWIEDRRGK